MYERALLQRLAVAHRGACTRAEPGHVVGEVPWSPYGAEPTGRTRTVGSTVMHEFSNGEGVDWFPHSSWVGVLGEREWNVSVRSESDRHGGCRDGMHVTVSAVVYPRGQGFGSDQIGNWWFPAHRRAFDGPGVTELSDLDLYLARDAFVEVCMQALLGDGRLDPALAAELDNGFDGWDNFPIDEFTLGERRWTGVLRKAGDVELRGAVAIGERAADGELEAWLGRGEDCVAFYTVVVRRDFVCATTTSDFMVDPYYPFRPNGPEVFRRPCPLTGDAGLDAARRDELKEEALEAVADHGRTMGITAVKRHAFEDADACLEEREAEVEPT
jgi:hypothetical protein